MVVIVQTFIVLILRQPSITRDFVWSQPQVLTRHRLLLPFSLASYSPDTHRRMTMSSDLSVNGFSTLEIARMLLEDLTSPAFTKIWYV